VRLVLALIAFTLFAAVAFAKLPAPTEEAKAKATVIATKSAWDDKMTTYQTCVADERVAEMYREASMRRSGALRGAGYDRVAVGSVGCPFPAGNGRRPAELASNAEGNLRRNAVVAT
jgi:hypothetical protein